MFYIHPDSEGTRLAGLPFMVAATAGNSCSAYAPTGVNLFPLTELLRPLHATAYRCGLAWSDPFLLYEANKWDDVQMTECGARYVGHLRQWAAAEARRTA